MIENIGKHYLYRHIRLDTGEPFYVGVGTKNKRRHNNIEAEYHRAYVKTGKKQIWKNIVNKTDYEVEILLESDDYDFIKQKEIEFVALYGRINLNTGILANLTDGGEGTLGRVVSEREKEICRATARKTFTGKPQSEEHKRKRFLYMCGENNPNYGKETTEEIKQKLRDALSGENCYASKRIEHEETGEIYFSIKNAAEMCGYNYSTLRAYLNGSLVNKTKLRYYEKKEQ